MREGGRVESEPPLPLPARGGAYACCSWRADAEAVGHGRRGRRVGAARRKPRLRLSPQSLASDPDSAGGTRLSAMATWTERAKMLTGRREDAVSRAAGACAAFPRGEGGNGVRAAGRWVRRMGELPFSSWNFEVLKYGYDMTEGGTVASAMLSERRVVT